MATKVRTSPDRDVIKFSDSPVVEDNDPNVAIIDEGVRAVTDAMMFYLVNAFPTRMFVFQCDEHRIYFFS